MSNEPEWRDANTSTENLPNKGKVIIQLIFGGIAFCILAAVCSILKHLGIGIGGFLFIFGLMMLLRKKHLFYAPGLIVAIAGFLLMLSIVIKPMIFITFPFGVGLIIAGIVKAVNLAWDVQKRV